MSERELERLQAIEEIVKTAMGYKATPSAIQVRDWFIRQEVARGLRNLMLKQILDEDSLL